MIVNSIKQIVLIVLLAALALAIIGLIFQPSFGNSLFDIPLAFLKKKAIG